MCLHTDSVTWYSAEPRVKFQSKYFEPHHDKLYPMGRGKNTIGRKPYIPWVEGQNTIDRELYIPWVERQSTIGRGFNIP